MSHQNIKTIKNRIVPNDIIYTPEPVAKLIIGMCDINPTDKVLDPCKGEGVFFNNYPECNKNWCEITENKDFFKYNDKVDWIIGNPPFSLWTKWLEHTAKITDNFCYIMGIMNLTSKRIEKIKNAGFAITKIHFLKVRWWFGDSIVIVCQKNNSESVISSSPEWYYCDICGVECYRGLKKKGKQWGKNECSNAPTVSSN